MEPLPDGYRATSYVVSSTGQKLTVRIGEPNRRLAEFIGEVPWAIVTASNPGGKRLAPAENARRHLQLLSRLSHLVTYPEVALPDDGKAWIESGLLVVGLTEAAGREVAAAFGQNAIVCGVGGVAPYLVDCRSSFGTSRAESLTE